MNMKKLIVILLIAAVFASCRKMDLYHDLTEEEANEILVVLHQEGVRADKLKEVRQNEVFWTIQVDPKRVTDARRLLVEHNLPRKRELGLSGVYKEKGLIPTPDEQKARYLLALKGEIINSLLKIPDVLDADVVINIPSPEEFATVEAKEKRPTASVVIKAKPTLAAESALSESRIQQFVANTVENLNPRDVSVIITYISAPKQGIYPGQSVILPNASDIARAKVEEQAVTRVAGVDVAAKSQKRLKIYLSVFFVVLAAMAGGLIVMVIRHSRMRQELKDIKGESAPMIEGKVVEEPRKLPGGKR
jgi:type III secretion protein J